MSRSLRPTSVLLLALLASACTAFPFDVERTELHLRIAPEQDAVELYEVLHGLESKEPHKGLSALRGFLTGRRLWPAQGGFLFELDIDQMEELGLEREFVTQPTGWLSQLAAKRLSASVQVQACGLFVDGTGRLCAWRRTRFERASGWCELLDRTLGDLLLEHAQELEPDPSEYPFDRETLDANLARARTGGRWMWLEGSRLVLDLPMSGAGAARTLSKLVEAQRQDPDDGQLSSFLSQVAALEVANGSLRLDLAGDAEGWMHFGPPPSAADSEGSVAAEGEPRETAPALAESAPAPDETWHGALLEAVRRAGLELETIEQQELRRTRILGPRGHAERR